MSSLHSMKLGTIGIALSLSTLAITVPVNVQSANFAAFQSQSSPFHRSQRNRFPCAAALGETEKVTAEKVNKNNGKVLISIGPPCSNKQQALESFLLSEGYGEGEGDESIEDAYCNINLSANSNGVYHRIPLAAFIYPTTRLTEKMGSKVLHSDVTVRDRLSDPAFEQTDTEIRNMILRLAGRLTPDEFAERVRNQALKAGDNIEYFRIRRMEITEDLINAMEEVAVEAIGEVLVQMQLKLDLAAEQEEELPYDEENEASATPLDLSTINATSAHLLSAKALVKTPYVSLYVPQCIFDGGIDRAQDQLSKLLIEESSMMPMAWDNTNTRPSEYTAALAAAEKAKRPVKFIAWGTQWMPRLSRKELLKRNIKKFRSTGRYIPAGAIGGALDRVETLVEMAETRARKMAEESSGDEEEWESYMDAAYANLGGFEMQKDGLVVKKGECRQLRAPFQNHQRKTVSRRRKR
eukprot:scaffold8150_cov118-Cylindrotheca_fusiformis.AAC.21